MTVPSSRLFPSWLLVSVIWVAFLVRGLFYCSVLPLWEGFDEWGYFAVIDRMVVTNTWIIDRDSKVSVEIEKSLTLAPLPRGMTRLPQGGLTRDSYATLPLAEQSLRESMLRNLPSSDRFEVANDGMPAYEASQPPLYYWLMSLSMRFVPANWNLIDRVWVARFITFLIGSLSIPVGFLYVRKVLEDDRLAIGLTALVALLPGLALDFARVSNESLSVLVFTCLLFAVYLLSFQLSLSRTVGAGLLLGLGLLTKAYFLTAVPAIVLVVVVSSRIKRATGRPMVSALILLLIALTLGGWWYARNWAETETISGLDEAVMLQGKGPLEKFSGVIQVAWPRAIATILISHVWYGGWSLLSLPKPLYFVALGFLGLIAISLIRLPRSVLLGSMFVPLALYCFFWLGQIYQIVMLFLSKGSSTAMGGWYLYCLVWAEVIVGAHVVIPISRFPLKKLVLPLFLAGAAMVDLFGLHGVSIPFYAGTRPLDTNSLHLLRNLPSFLDSSVLAVLWVGYLVATAVVLVAGMTVVSQHGRVVPAHRPHDIAQA